MSEESIMNIKERLKDNYDVKYREVGNVKGNITLIFIDNLCDSKYISEYIVAPLEENKDKSMDKSVLTEEILKACIVGNVKDIEDAFIHILSGDVVIVCSEFDDLVFCEAKSYARRSVSTPTTENVVKGPKEGFTEAFVDNVSLIRRKIKNPDLKFQSFYVGKNSNTPVVICYIKGMAPDSLVEYIKTSIRTTEDDFILDSQYIEERIRNKKTIFDTIGYSEKPDVISSKLLQGRVGIIVDGSPFVITAPYFFIENFQMPDDYYINKYLSNILRALRYLSFFIALFLPALYLSLTTYHFSLIPSVIVFRLAVSRAGVPFPTIIEVILMLFFFEILREAGIRLPQPVGQAMSIVGALILGDAAVGAGLASQSTLVIVALSSISSFIVPKLFGPLIAWQIILIFFAGFLGLPGFYIGTVIMIAHVSALKSCGYFYLNPLGTQKELKYKDVILRGELKEISHNNLNGDDNNEI